MPTTRCVSTLASSSPIEEDEEEARQRRDRIHEEVKKLFFREDVDTTKVPGRWAKVLGRTDAIFTDLFTLASPSPSRLSRRLHRPTRRCLLTTAFASSDEGDGADSCCRSCDETVLSVRLRRDRALLARLRRAAG